MVVYGIAGDVESDLQSNPDVRAATPEDAHTLAALCEAHAAFELIAYQAQGHATRLRAALRSARLHAWLAWQDGRAVGYAAATLDFSTLHAHSYLHLDCLYLEPHARGQGLGDALVQAVLRFARLQACSNVQWQTPPWNAGAIRFYNRLGAARLDKARFTLQA